MTRVDAEGAASRPERAAPATQGPRTDEALLARARDLAPMFVGRRADHAARDAAHRLRAAGLPADDAGREARLFVQAALDVMRPKQDVRLAPETVLDPAAGVELARCVEARRARRPVAYIVGRRAFWRFAFAVDEGVLIPRPETEHLVEALLAAVDQEPAGRAGAWRALDLGVGSGAILLSLLAELPQAWGVGVDRSMNALRVAAINRAGLDADIPGVASRCALICGDWATSLTPKQPFDVIACNPPYIATATLTKLQAEVRDHEPRLALDGGASGLDAYQRLAPELVRLLRPGGTAALEVGVGQSEAVAALCRAAGADVTSVVRDLSGVDRALVVRRP